MKTRISIAVSAICIAFLLLYGNTFVSGEPARPPLKILVSGFGPFGGNSTNPTGELARRFTTPGKIGNALVKGVELPVVYYEAWNKLEPAIKEFNPDFILSLGLDSGARGIRIESVAYNEDRGYRDNAGTSHSGEIIAGGLKAIASDLPVEKIVSALKNKGIPAYISDDAGGYLCNHIFYHIMNYRINHPNVASAFVHMPSWPIDGRDSKNLMSALETIIEQIDAGYRRVALMAFEPKKGDVKGNVDRMVKAILDCPANRVDFAIFPEMSLTGLVWKNQEEIGKISETVDGYSVATLADAASRSRVWVSFGFAEKDADSDKLYNSYLVLDPSGKKNCYRKRHLFGSDINWAAVGDSNQTTSIPTSLGNTSIAICHDVVFPDTYKGVPKKTGVMIIGTNWIGNTPISSYLLKFRPDGAMILLADRKGEESGIDFKGNTLVITRDGLTIKNNRLFFGDVPTLIYSFIDNN